MSGDRPTSKRSYSVLIVDDDESFRMAHKRLLTMIRDSVLGATFKVADAGDHGSAIEYLDNNQVDCVLLDYKMPGDDGITALGRFAEKHPNVAIVLFTGHGSEKVAVDAMKAGAMDYIIKGDITIEALEKVILNSVEKKEMALKIEEQRQQLIEAERYKVMNQSLGAACHHLGQPATVLRGYLVMLKREEMDKQKKEIVVEAFKAVETICDVLRRFKLVKEYKTEQYLELKEEDEGKYGDNQILQI